MFSFSSFTRPQNITGKIWGAKSYKFLPSQRWWKKPQAIETIFGLILKSKMKNSASWSWLVGFEALIGLWCWFTWSHITFTLRTFWYSVYCYDLMLFVFSSHSVFIFFASSLSSVSKGHRGPCCRKHQYGKCINFFCCCNLWAIFLLITWYKEGISSLCLLSAPFRLVRSASLSHTRDERRTLIPRSLSPKRNFLPPKTSHWLQGPHVRQVTSVWCMVGGAAKKKLVCVW